MRYIVGLIFAVILILASVYFYNTNITQTSDNNDDISPSPAQELSPTPTNGQNGDTEEIKLYFVGLDGEGFSGETFGCNDVVVPVTRQIPATKGILRATLDELLSENEMTVSYNDRDLYNVFYRSNLQVESVVVKSGIATIRLRGELTLGGTCDSPRVEAQLVKTAMQFPSVESVEIYINNRTLGDVLFSQ